MALAATALVTVAEARTYLQVEADDKPPDALLEQIIEGLTDGIVGRTGKTYVNPVAADAESTRAYMFMADEKKVHIDNVRAISKVEVTATPQDNDSWVEMEDDDGNWVAEPVGLPVQHIIRFLMTQELPASGIGWSGLALHTHVQDSTSTPWPRQARASVTARAYIRVTGKYGMGANTASVPGNVKLATLMWLQNIHKRDQAFFSETIGVASALTKMPGDVEALLENEMSEGAQVQAV